MSCAGKGYGTNPKSDDYVFSQFYSLKSFTPKSTRNCRKFKPSIPSFKPILSGLSTTTSPSGGYSLVYITGSNFLPNATTLVKFGNYGYISAIYYSSFNISFIVPLNVIAGNYSIQVANIYNGNFSPEVNQSYPGNINLSSNAIAYTIT